MSYLYQFIGITHSHMHFGAYQWQGNDRAWQTLSVITNFWCHNCFVCQLYWCPYRVRDGAVGWGTAIESGKSRVRFPMVSLEFFIDIKFWIGVPVPRFAPWKHCSQLAYSTIPRFSKRSYFGRQVPLASTTRGSPLAAKGGTMGEKWWPNSAWDIHPGFFYIPQICDMGPIILLPFRRKACWWFLSPCKNPTALAGVWTRELGYQRPARYLCTTETA